MRLTRFWKPVPPSPAMVVPVRNPLAKLTPIPAGVRLTAPRAGSAMGRFLGIKPGQKTFELDDQGAAVWALCDGARNVIQIVDRFAAAQGMEPKSAFGVVTTFLNTLAKRRLIGFVGPR